MKQKSFMEFISELNGANLDDRALLDLLFYQCDRVYREAGNPISLGVRQLRDGYVLNIYAKVNGRYFLYEFATVPAYSEFVTDGASDRYGEYIYSQYRETECKTREELLQVKRFMEGSDLGASHAETFYPRSASGDDTKLVIAGFYTMWKRIVPEMAFRTA